MNKDSLLDDLSEDRIEKVIYALYAKYGPVRHQMESFEKFIDVLIKQIIFSEPSMVIDSSETSPPTRHIIDFKHVIITEPLFKESNGQTRKVYPYECRQRRLTYNSSVLVDIEYKIFDITDIDTPKIMKTQMYREVLLCQIPIMIGSRFCNTKNTPSLANECPLDPGGYFIINGSEKIIISQERMRNNFPYIFALKQPNKYEYVCEIRSLHEKKVRSTSTLYTYITKIGSTPEIFVELPFIEGFQVPLAAIFRILGFTNKKDMIDCISRDTEDSELQTLIETLVEQDLLYTSRSIEELYEWIGKEGTSEPTREKRIRAVEHLFNNEFLPHSGLEKTEDVTRKRILTFGNAVNKLCQVYLHRANPDDRDDYAYKRADTAGFLLCQLFRPLVKAVTKNIISTVKKNVDNGKPFNLNEVVNHKRITSGIRYSMSTGNWGVQKGGSTHKGVAQVHTRMTHTSSLSNLRRVNTHINKEGKMPKPRQLHFSCFGFLCCVETPEGQSCLTADTQVLLADGITTISIKDLVEQNQPVAVYNTETGKIEAADIYDSFSKEVTEQLYEITLTTGEIVKSTGDHPFWTTNGWTEAQNLTSADKLMTVTVPKQESIIREKKDLREKVRDLYKLGLKTGQIVKELAADPEEIRHIIGDRNKELKPCLPKQGVIRFDDYSSEPQFVAIKSIRRCPAETVYDFTVDHPSHSFIANSMVSHNCGLLKNLGILGHIRIGSDPQMIMETLRSVGKCVELKNSSKNDITSGVNIYVNGVFWGYTHEPVELIAILRQKRFSQVIPFDVSLGYDKKGKAVSVQCDPGCFLRPAFVVENLYKFASIFEQYYFAAPFLIWDLLMREGVIEYFDVEEMRMYHVAACLDDLVNQSSSEIPYTHLEIDTSSLFGACASTIPFPDRNQAPRVIYQVAMGKQSTAKYNMNSEYRTDTISQYLMYPQRPQVQTFYEKLLNLDKLPTGQNVKIAIMTYTGFNQEDSVICNRSSEDRGMFRALLTRCHRDELKTRGTDSMEFEKPDVKTCKGIREANYDKIQANGLPLPGTIIENGEIFIGKTMSSADPSLVNKSAGSGSINGGGSTSSINRNKNQESKNIKRDNSTIMKHDEVSVVERVVKTTNRDGFTSVNVTTRTVMHPDIGDKFCLTDDHDILTEQGWKKISDFGIDLSCKVATLVDGYNLDYVKPSDFYEFEHDGPMYKIDTPQISMMTTLNHKMWVQKSSDEGFEFEEAKNVAGTVVKYQKCATNTNTDYNHFFKSTNCPIPTDIIDDIAATLIESIIANIIKIIDKKELNTEESKLCDLLYKLQLAEAGFLASINQYDRAYMNAWLTFFGLWVSKNWSIAFLNNYLVLSCAHISIKNSDKMAIYLKTLSTETTVEKRLPNWVWKLSQNQCRTLIQCITQYEKEYSTNSVDLADDIQKLALHCGWSANITVVQTNNNSVMYVIVITTENAKNYPTVNLGDRTQEKEEIIDYFQGKVYCIQVPETHLFYVRKNGKSCWTGNSSRHGQKGTRGMYYTHEDMPFASDGRTPDIIVNPHALPSRMTVGMLLEGLLAKVACSAGEIGNGKPFRGLSMEELGDELTKYGLQRHGNELLYDGFTGEAKEVAIFFADTFYQRLKHVTAHKMHARARGPKQILTRQPTEGRAKFGGLRIGEMERDTFITYGSANVIMDRLFLNSDAYETVLCGKCGLFAEPARPKNKEIKGMTIRAEKPYCRNCDTHEGIHVVRIPYACKLVIQEMYAMSIAVRLRVSKDIDDSGNNILDVHDINDISALSQDKNIVVAAEQAEDNVELGDAIIKASGKKRLLDNDTIINNGPVAKVRKITPVVKTSKTKK